jgi:hypothetical protein
MVEHHNWRRAERPTTPTGSAVPRLPHTTVRFFSSCFSTSSSCSSSSTYSIRQESLLGRSFTFCMMAECCCAMISLTFSSKRSSESFFAMYDRLVAFDFWSMYSWNASGWQCLPAQSMYSQRCSQISSALGSYNHTESLSTGALLVALDRHL